MQSNPNPLPVQAEPETPIEPEVKASKVLRFPHPSLLGRAFPVEAVDDNVREIAAELVAIMKAEDGMGLAAPQIGMNLRIIVVSAGPGAEPQVLCDPMILCRRGQEWGLEACLSLPGIQGRVMRSSWITVTARDLNDQVVDFQAEGMYARVIQHEIDHLDGIMFTSKLGPLDKSAARKKLEKLAVDFAIEQGSGDHIRGVPVRKVYERVVHACKSQAVFA